MQTLPGQEHFHTVTAGSQTRNAVLVALILFAMAGLISGFAVGAFAHPNKAPSVIIPNQPTHALKTKVKQTPTATNVSLQPISLGEPVIDSYQPDEIANGSTTYTFTGHVVNKQNSLLRTSSVTCKIWLTKDGNVSPNITENRLQSVSTLDQPFPKETHGALLFTAATSQTQMCQNGQGTWSYQIAPTTKPGQYYIVLLTDWNGIHYNWSWVAIRIHRQG
jgi:hypothetical protein